MSEQDQPAAPQGKAIITYDDFAKLDLRTAKVLSVSAHPNADKLIVLNVDLGTEQRQLVAGLKPYLADPQSLVGKNIVVVCNLEPRKMRGLESKGMLLAATTAGPAARRVVILTTDQDVPPGSVIS